MQNCSCDGRTTPALWEVSGTVRPFTREEIEQFILRQQEGIHRCGQQRWMIENEKDEVVGTIDLFEFDPHRRKAGVGILVYDPAQRRRGYARQALEALEEYAQRELQLERLWCEIFSDNEASLALFRGARGIRRQESGRDEKTSSEAGDARSDSKRSYKTRERSVTPDRSLFS